MHLRYLNNVGKEVILRLGSDAIVVGRAPDCEVSLHDDRVSRRHCEIRPWDEGYAIKDLRSQNGTLLNGEKVGIAMLQAGDEIRIGGTVFYFEEKKPLGEDTAIKQIEDSMEEGKGYHTILREIVQESDKSPPKSTQ